MPERTWVPASLDGQQRMNYLEQLLKASAQVGQTAGGTLPEQEVESVEDSLASAERALEEGRGLRGTGFWKAVDLVRRRPQLAERYADRIGDVDRTAFAATTKFRVPAEAGTILLGAGTAAGLFALVLAGRLDDPVRTLFFLAGFAILEVAPHSLVHWVVGRALGMRFSGYFLGGPPPPRPGVKVDYASYLRSSPRRRAAMHASGAVLTKLVPFLMIPVAQSLALSRWVLVVLWVVGVGQIITDLLFSTKSSDWKKVRRELRAARSR